MLCMEPGRGFGAKAAAGDSLAGDGRGSADDKEEGGPGRIDASSVIFAWRTPEAGGGGGGAGLLVSISMGPPSWPSLSAVGAFLFL